MRRRKTVPKPAIYLALFLILSVLVFFFIFFISVNNIECRSQFGQCPREIDAALNNLKGKKLLLIKKEIGEVLAGMPVVLDFSSQYKIPSSIIINMVLRKPAFAIGARNEKKYALVDPEGKILLVSESSQLPTVYISDALPIEGEIVSAKFLNALKLQYGTYIMHQVKEGEIAGESLVIELTDGPRLIFPLEEDVDLLLGKLRAIWSKISKEAYNYREIDLRFRNPILR